MYRHTVSLAHCLLFLHSSAGYLSLYVHVTINYQTICGLFPFSAFQKHIILSYGKSKTLNKNTDSIKTITFTEAM